MFWCLSGTFEESGWTVPMHNCQKQSHQGSSGDQWKEQCLTISDSFFSHNSQLECCGNAWYRSIYLAWRLCSALQRTDHYHAICVLTHPYCAHGGGFFETIKYTVNTPWPLNSCGIHQHASHQLSDLKTWFGKSSGCDFQGCNKTFWSKPCYSLLALWWGHMQVVATAVWGKSLPLP